MAFVIIMVIMLIKYKPAYKVTIAGEAVGYVASQKAFEEEINEKIINPDNKNVAFVDLGEEPQFEFLLVDNTTETNEEEIFAQVQEAAVTTYKMYAITLNNENTVYVDTRDEAEEIINKMKEESSAEDIDIGMQEIYTQDVETVAETVEVAKATEVAENQLNEKVQEQERIKSATFEGIYFSVRPVTGTITSRFGAVESIRDHTHMGIDIGAANGTPILAAADGTVTYSGWMGGYGNLIIISHGNGVQTYYGHASKLYVSEGTEVKAGDKIAAVGSTGNSTGNHLHFEIRKNGTQVNPQKYLYK